MMRLRQATDEDDEFCFRLNVATMREYIEPIYGWDVDVQRSYHAGWFNPDRLSIIEDDDGRPIGVLDVIDKDDHLSLSRIEVLPEAQGLGFIVDLDSEDEHRVSMYRSGEDSHLASVE
jgi:hypothetical protein